MSANEIRRIDSNGRRSRVVIHNAALRRPGRRRLWRRHRPADAGSARPHRQAAGRGGSERRKVLSATIWLKDMADYAGMNAVWDRWIDPDHAPARCCGVVEMADPGIRVEIILTAAQ